MVLEFSIFVKYCLLTVIEIIIDWKNDFWYNKTYSIGGVVFMNLNKVVCSCYKVTKGDVLKAVENGASSFKDVKKETKLGKACGKCKKKGKKLTKKLLSEQK